MQHWILATLIGIGLGLMLYGCVRLRIHLGPRLQARFGNWARSAYWLLTIIVMVILANFSLLTLRDLLADLPDSPNDLLLELWFAALAAGIALFLIYSRVKRNS
ncbi:MAG: hypothetical protein QNJ73_07195 [Gammaproteobacteria bacterium]|nr:hypothetical protein [Gammaproteobacteria bacterium]